MSRALAAALVLVGVVLGVLLAAVLRTGFRSHEIGPTEILLAISIVVAAALMIVAERYRP